jgi:hypothetical protein
VESFETVVKKGATKLSRKKLAEDELGAVENAIANRLRALSQPNVA